MSLAGLESVFSDHLLVSWFCFECVMAGMSSSMPCRGIVGPTGTLPTSVIVITIRSIPTCTLHVLTTHFLVDFDGYDDDGALAA